MKKSMVFVLVLSLVLGASSLIMASGFEADRCGPGCGPMAGDLCITARVPVYGEVDLPNTCLHLEFPCGKDNELKKGTAQFSIRSNAYMHVTAGLSALNYVIDGEVNKIKTTADIKEKQIGFWNTVSWNDFIKVETKSFKSVGKNMPGVNGSGKGVRNYKVDITGQLGRIEEQAAGFYNGNLKITLAARP